MKKILIAPNRNLEKKRKSLQLVHNKFFDVVNCIRYEKKKVVVCWTTIRKDLRFVSFLNVNLSLAEGTII